MDLFDLQIDKMKGIYFSHVSLLFSVIFPPKYVVKLR